MNRTTRIACLTLTLIAFAPGAVSAQPAEPKQNKVGAPKAAGAADQLVIRVYNVADLVMPTARYPFRGTSVPTFGVGSTSNPSLPMPGIPSEGGGGMGGFGSIDSSLQSPFDLESTDAQRAMLATHGGRAPGRTVALAQPGGNAPVHVGGARPGSNPPLAPASGHEASNPGRFDIDTLQEVLTATIDPESWN